jgi:hypothetical protein
LLRSRGEGVFLMPSKELRVYWICVDLRKTLGVRESGCKSVTSDVYLRSEYKRVVCFDCDLCSRKDRLSVSCLTRALTFVGH